ncbi:MAG: hypothetical protein P8Y39_11955, partial [Nitrospirota bacterium]
WPAGHKSSAVQNGDKDEGTVDMGGMRVDVIVRTGPYGLVVLQWAGVHTRRRNGRLARVSVRAGILNGYCESQQGNDNAQHYEKVYSPIVKRL